MITRRQLLKLGAFSPGVALALTLLGLGTARSMEEQPAAPATANAHGGHGAATTGRIVAAPAASPSFRPFTIPLPIPATLQPTARDETTDYYDLTMRERQVEILPGLKTAVWGFDGAFPGPTIRAVRGRQAVIRQTNMLPEEMSVHLHGGHQSADSDGHPNDAIAPGATREYRYPNAQLAATLWYHDHAMLKTAPHIWKGLAGFYLLDDPAEAALNLPSGDYDVPLMIQDRRFNADGSFYYPPAGSPSALNGFSGDVLLANGAPQPFLAVANRKYRFRLLNGSNAQGYTFALQQGDQTVPLTQIASDGGLLPAPVVRPALTLWQAERAEIVIDFAAFPLGTRLMLKNTAGAPGLDTVMRFDVVRAEAEPSALPAALRPFVPLDPIAATTTRTFYTALDQSTGKWTISGNTYDPARIDAQPILGTTEIWQFVNVDTIVHPMHLHHSPVQILDRNGVAPTLASGEVGWKDTVAVQPGETVRVLVQFTGYLGTYVFHCHHLEHEDHDMMGQFEVIYGRRAIPRKRGNKTDLGE